MTTKLLPRLIATGVVAAALSGISAVTGLATSAHAATPATSPVVTAGPQGSLNVNLTYAQVAYAGAERSQAQQLCTDTIVPAADAISAGQLRVPTCTTFTQHFAMTLAAAHKPVVISFLANGDVLGHAVS